MYCCKLHVCIKTQKWAEMIKLWIKDRENSSQARSLSLFVYTKELSIIEKRQNVVFIDCCRMIEILTYTCSGKNYDIFRKLTNECEHHLGRGKHKKY